MKRAFTHIATTLLTLLFILPAAIQAQIGVMQFPEGKVQHVVYANDIHWAPCPPSIPHGCGGMAVLDGIPKTPDLFTVRFLVSDGFYMPKHWHPKDERVTVLEGKAYVVFGKDGTRDGATAFGPGDYYVNKREEIHQVWADPGTIIQITGIGPWEAHFIEE